MNNEERSGKRQHVSRRKTAEIKRYSDERLEQFEKERTRRDGDGERSERKPYGRFEDRDDRRGFGRRDDERGERGFGRRNDERGDRRGFGRRDDERGDRRSFGRFEDRDDRRG
ncbi:MAG: hypothetical protein ACI358_06715, partial [Candidatus Limimorpha sp.]